MSNPNLHVTSLGGGHGLYQTLLATRRLNPASITAIVTVADDGGSSGRLRREFGMIPPGDLRMALSALSADDEDGELWRRTLQHRFGGTGALAGHSLGNLLIAGLSEVLGSHQAAYDRIAELTRSTGRVLPMVNEPLDIEADVAGLDDDPRIMRPVRGQVAVATTPGSVRRVRLIPEHPDANPLAVEAIRTAGLVTLGPGSWFSSVLPHLMVPDLVVALNESAAHRAVVLNLTAEPGETQGFSSERHIHMLSQHAPSVMVDSILVDNYAITTRTERGFLERAAATIGAEVVYRDLHRVDESGRPTYRHDPEKLAAAFRELAAS